MFQLFWNKLEQNWNRPRNPWRTSSSPADAFGARAEDYLSLFLPINERKQALNCGDGKIDIALIALMAYNEMHIDEWLSTRPVLDAGLLSGIGAERSVE